MSHCHRFQAAPLSRREMLQQCAGGFGSIAFAGLFPGAALADESSNRLVCGALAAPHHMPRVKNVIFLYMDGGPSQVDTFDPKTRLQTENGEPFKMEMEPTQFDNNGATLGSPWRFRRYGECGHEISDLFGHVAESADELCVIRSMTSEFSEHTNANYFLHTGLGIAGRPSMGAWISYGLGNESQNLPGFVVLNGGLIPPGGLDCFTNSFLPATHQGSIFRPDDRAVANIHPQEESQALQRKKLALLGELDAANEGLAQVDAIESAIANHELAFRMQAAVPELMDLSGESVATKKLYGFDSSYEPTRIYARQCLLARRMVERGVRFVELTCPQVDGDRWDQHSNLRAGHENNARAVDQPIGGLLKDLKARGLLDETLVIWGAEFGRTPFAQGSNGRDHNPFGYSIWMAGGGVRGGTVYGATDEYGYKVVEKPVEMYDFHATILHLLGIDHTRLTVPFSGRDMRLTDVHGHVIYDVLA